MRSMEILLSSPMIQESALKFRDAIKSENAMKKKFKPLVVGFILSEKYSISNSK